MEIKNLKRDNAILQEGAWVKDIPGSDDLELKVRGLTSSRVMMLRSEKERTVSKAERTRDGRLRPDAGIKVFREVLLEAVLIDWRNLTDNGVAVPYSKEMAEKLLLDPDYTEFADAVSWAAQIVDMGNKEADDELVGN